MLDDVGANVKRAQIRAALERAKAIPSAKAQASQIAKRLDEGVRIVLLGPKGVGKSQLCRALLDLSNGVQGAEETQIFTSQEVCDDTLLAETSEMQVVRQVADTRRLGHVQVIDVSVAQPTAANLAARCEDFMPHADIVLWCTETFSKDEQDLWAAASDPLKDHSFLVLTKADLLAENETLAVRIAELQRIVAEEFHSLFPTATGQVQQVLQAGEAVSDAQLAASGVKALAEAVYGIVRSGERADLDGALLFLERHAIPLDDTLSATKTVADAPTAREAKPVYPSFTKARDVIMERAIDLAEMTFDADQGDMSEMLAYCGEISEELVEIIAQDTPQSSDEAQWHEVFEEASDKVMLMTMENDLRSAADAVTILLQLRRDLEAMTTH